VAGLAAGLSLDGVAEGVETREQAATLLAQGWSHGQGYLFGRPEAAPRATSLVRPPY
jgi:EAL domain-containing protein (putative c-di-GMP-specific phosphodiesterase class I)